MLYFIKEGTIHRFPQPRRCSAVRTSEQLRDTIPTGVRECTECLRRWPEDH